MELNCIDAMRCSSPPHSSSSSDYGSLKKPSAVDSFTEIIKQAKGKKVVVFLDYDGTLSPIVDQADLAFMCPTMRSAVKNVAEHFSTAIVSGRSLDKVKEFVKLEELYYAGSHGMDIVGPKGTSDSKEIHFQPDAIRNHTPLIPKLIESLTAATHDIKGVNVENNKFCCSVHFRNVAAGGTIFQNLHKVAEIVEKIVKGYQQLFKITHGRKVLEIRPNIEWNKGDAVEFLLKTLRLEDGARVLPIYIGDDRTDEDAFKVFKKRGYGIGILVSSAPKPTDAEYSLENPRDVRRFLETLANWKTTPY